MEGHKNRLHMLLDVEEEASGGWSIRGKGEFVTTCVLIFQPFLLFCAVAGFGGKMVSTHLKYYC